MYTGILSSPIHYVQPSGTRLRRGTGNELKTEHRTAVFDVVPLPEAALLHLH
jgi:hypothetical protein